MVHMCGFSIGISIVPCEPVQVSCLLMALAGHGLPHRGHAVAVAGHGRLGCGMAAAMALFGWPSRCLAVVLWPELAVACHAAAMPWLWLAMAGWAVAWWRQWLGKAISHTWLVLWHSNGWLRCGIATDSWLWLATLSGCLR